MRKLPRLIFFTFLVLVVVGGALYSGMWYMQASRARDTLEDAIARINQNQQLITYESIETTGFPSRVNIRIVQPKFSGRMDQILAPLRHPTPDKPMKPWPEWIEEIAWAGSISFSSNLTSDEFTFSIDGPVTHISDMGGDRMTMVHQPKGRFYCTIALKESGVLSSTLWDIDRLVDNLGETFKELKLLECATPGNVVLADPTGEELASNGQIFFRLFQELNNEKTALTFSFKVKDYEMKAGLNAYVNRYVNLLSEGPASPLSIDFASYGQQNADIEFSLYGNFSSGGVDEQPYSINLSRFNLSNALYETTGHLLIEQSIESPTRKLVVNLSSENTFTQAYDRYVEEYVNLLVSQVKDSEEPEVAELRELLAPYTTEQAVAMLAPVLPKLHSFGTMKFFADAVMQQNRDKDSTFIIVKGIELSTMPYGATLSGSSYLPPANQPFYAPGANFTLRCRNCLTLVDDITRYVQRVQTTLATFDPSQANTPPWVSQPLSDNIKQFMETLAIQEQDSLNNATTLVFKLKGDDTGNLMLNDKSPMEVMELFSTLIAPNLPSATEEPPAEETKESDKKEKKK